MPDKRVSDEEVRQEIIAIEGMIADKCAGLHDEIELRLLYAIREDRAKITKLEAQYEKHLTRLSEDNNSLVRNVMQLKAQLEGTQARENMFSRAVTDYKAQIAAANAKIERVNALTAYGTPRRVFLSDIREALADTKAQ